MPTIIDERSGVEEAPVTDPRLQPTTRFWTLGEDLDIVVTYPAAPKPVISGEVDSLYQEISDRLHDMGVKLPFVTVVEIVKIFPGSRQVQLYVNQLPAATVLAAMYVYRDNPADNPIQPLDVQLVVLDPRGWVWRPANPRNFAGQPVGKKDILGRAIDNTRPICEDLRQLAQEQLFSHFDLDGNVGCKLDQVRPLGLARDNLTSRWAITGLVTLSAGQVGYIERFKAGIFKERFERTHILEYAATLEPEFCEFSLKDWTAPAYPALLYLLAWYLENDREALTLTLEADQLVHEQLAAEGGYPFHLPDLDTFLASLEPARA